jgi:hypothetical protein
MSHTRDKDWQISPQRNVLVRRALLKGRFLAALLKWGRLPILLRKLGTPHRDRVRMLPSGTTHGNSIRAIWALTAL